MKPKYRAHQEQDQYFQEMAYENKNLAKRLRMLAADLELQAFQKLQRIELVLYVIALSIICQYELMKVKRTKESNLHSSISLGLRSTIELHLSHKGVKLDASTLTRK